MSDKAMEVLLPKTKIIVFCGRKVEIGPLSCRKIDQALKLLKESAVKVSLEKPQSDGDVMLGLFRDLGERAGELAAILSGVPAEETAEVSLMDVSELALALAETNDFGKIFSNFTQAMELSKPKK